MSDSSAPPADDRHPEGVPDPNAGHVEVHGSAFSQVTTERDGVEITPEEAEADLPMDQPDAVSLPSSRDLAAEQHSDD